MHQNDKPSIEFLNPPDSSASGDKSSSASNQDLKDEGVVRTAYRLPIEPSDPVRLVIGGRTYQLMNISGRGAQIDCTQSEGLAPEQEIESMELQIGDATLEVSGEVIYVASLGPHQKACGIYFQTASDADQRTLEDFLARKRQQIFSAGQ